jgi:hypothetical protein
MGKCGMCQISKWMKDMQDEETTCVATHEKPTSTCGDEEGHTYVDMHTPTMT